MTDKPTPTDAELKAMWQLHAADIGGIFYYARAVLAKWGQPAQARAGAVPLDEARRLFDAGWKAAALFCDREDVVADGIIGFGACPQVEAAFSAAHGIKGGASMALSKSALKRAIDSVPEGHDVGVWVVRVCRAVEAEVRKQDDALIRQLVEYIEQNTCQHEETHRGGAIWEICDGCNAQWADDRGGKPKFAWAPIVLAARARLGGKP